ncbi:MAG: response regulator [Desulfuromonadia bacterium]
MGKILIIDDDTSFTSALEEFIHRYYPTLQVETCSNSLMALPKLRRGAVDLLLIDLEMPNLDGAKIMQFAKSVGIDKNRIVILSGREADYLHERFPMGTCLAVLNKYEAKQKDVLGMILGSIDRKVRAA